MKRNILLFLLLICILGLLGFGSYHYLKKSDLKLTEKPNVEVNDFKNPEDNRHNVDNKEEVDQVKVDELGDDLKEEITSDNEQFTVSQANKTEKKKESSNKSNSTIKSENKNAKTDSGVNNKVENKNATSKKEESKEEKKSDSSKPSQPDTPAKTEEPKMWEKLGITENEYNNSPMRKNQKVTHLTMDACILDGDEAIKAKIDSSTGKSYQDYNQYWCHEVVSYSGRRLGYMLDLKKLS